jgi:hypothetical protein
VLTFRFTASVPANWWSDIGFAGRCPACGRWIHFTISAKAAISEEAALVLPKLPEDWCKNAIIL